MDLYQVAVYLVVAVVAGILAMAGAYFLPRIQRKMKAVNVRRGRERVSRAKMQAEPTRYLPIASSTKPDSRPSRRKADKGKPKKLATQADSVPEQEFRAACGAVIECAKRKDPEALCRKFREIFGGQFGSSKNCMRFLEFYRKHCGLAYRTHGSPDGKTRLVQHFIPAWKKLGAR